MDQIYNGTGDTEDAWLSGRLKTGKVIEVHIGRKRIGSLSDKGVYRT